MSHVSVFLNAQDHIHVQKEKITVIYASFKPFTGKIKCLTQNIKVELESVQEELSSTRKDKFMLQAKVGELRNSMKTVLLQNQQLKQDFKQSRLRKVKQLFVPWTVVLCDVFSAFL